MKLSKKYIFILSILTVVSGAYCIFLFGLPVVLNSPNMIAKYESFLSKRLGVPVKIEDFEFKSKPDFSFSIFSKSISGGEFLSIENLKLRTKSFSVKPKTLDADNIYVNYYELKNRLNTTQNKDKEPFEIKYFPVINIKKAYLQMDKNNKSFIQFDNIKSEKKGFNIICTFNGKFQTPYAKTPIIIGKTGGIHYFRKLYFDDLSVGVENSNLVLSGPIDKFLIKGLALPAKELDAAFLYFYKLKHPNKKNFIENFSKFSGNIDVDLVYSKNGLSGKCIAHNLGADFWSYKIPVLLPNVVFNFNGRSMDAKATGLFGPELVYTDVKIEGIFTKSVEVKGDVRSKLTNNFTKKYFKPVQISGRADAEVKYHVHNSIVDVEYILTVPKDSNLITKYGRLDNIDNIRQISAQTSKHGNTIYLKNYDFSFIKDHNKQIFLFGDGLFKKFKGHYKPSFLTLKTNGKVSTDFISSVVNDFIYCGTFTSDLKYDFTNKILTGYLNLYDICHEDFLYLKNTNINITNNELTINANGEFFDSPIVLSLLADNKFQKNLLIHNIDIHLDKFYVRRGGFGSVSSIHKNTVAIKHHKHQDYDITVEKGKIKVDEIINPRFYLHDVEIDGTLKNNIADFVIPQTNYANGILCAKGKYNIKKHASDIYFAASEINSNEVATKMFSLPDQFEGNAYATLHLLTKDKFNDIKANATFAIENGLMPKLGSREFILNKSAKRKNPLYYIKKPIKFTLSKITNIDFSNKQVLSTDIQGSFILDNSDVKCAKIFSQSDFLSMYIEGDYNIDTQIGELLVWGKRNKTAEKKIRILKLPLSLLYKIFFRVERSKNLYQNEIKQIPDIKGRPEEIGIFRVQVNGNLNSNDIKVTLKDIR